jgi:hypothetical protein
VAGIGVAGIGVAGAAGSRWPVAPIAAAGPAQGTC